MSEDNPISKGISHNTHITIGVLVTVIGVAAWLIRGQANTEYELKLIRIEIKSSLAELQQRIDSTGADRWTFSDMRRWSRDFKAANPTIVVPDTEHK